MLSNFDACMVEVFAHEGGYVNHPKDPGGETNYGITKRTYPKLDIKNLTKDEAKAIYRKDFWTPIWGDELPAGIDLAVLDPSINSGRSRGVTWMQKALGVTADGRMGPNTVKAAKGANPVLAVQKACANRMGFLRGLKTWGTFGKGWSRRVARVEAVGVKMAMVAHNADPKPTLKIYADVAKGQATTERNSAVGSGGLGAGGISFVDLPTWGIAVAVVVIVALVVMLMGRARHEKDREEAYKEAANG